MDLEGISVTKLSILILRQEKDDRELRVLREVIGGHCCHPP